MILLTKTKNIDVRFLLSPHNYTWIYNVLKENFHPNNLEYLTFFAKPTVVADTTKWFHDTNEKISGSKIKSFDDLSEEDKDNASDLLEIKKAEILPLLKTIKEFEGFHDAFFRVPDINNIKIIENTDEEPTIILTEWACEPASIKAETDPLSVVINRPKPDRTNVVINVTYSDDNIAADKILYFDYKKITAKKIKTNKKGQKTLGKFKFGSEITVYEILDDGQQFARHDFVVTEGAKYNVVLPILTNAQIKIINQKKQTLANYNVNIEYLSAINIETSNQLGIIKQENIIVSEKLTISETEKPENNQTYTIEKEKNDFIFQVFQPFYQDVAIKVVNQFDEILPNTFLLIEYEGQNTPLAEREHFADNEGMIFLKNILEGTTIRLKEKENIHNIDSYTVQETDNEFTFVIKQPVYADASIKVINQFEETVPNITLKLDYDAKDIKHTTTQADSDNEGMIFLKNILENSQIKAIEKENDTNTEIYELTETEKDFIFRIKTPEATKIYFKLIDHKKRPVADQEIQFTYKDEKYTVKTDQNGGCYLSLMQVNDGDFIETLIKVDKKRKIKKLKFLKKKK